MTPSLHLITGPMFSGKTEKLINLVKEAEWQGQKIYTIKPALDDRYDPYEIVSHSGKKLGCRSVRAISDEFIQNLIDGPPDILAIDEAQLFPSFLSHDIILHLNARGCSVIAAGLDLDFKGRPFEGFQHLMPYADRLSKLTAVCHKCQSPFACRTQRVQDGHELTDGRRIMVGGQEQYEARCLDCFVWPEMVISKSLKKQVRA